MFNNKNTYQDLINMIKENAKQDPSDTFFSNNFILQKIQEVSDIIYDNYLPLFNFYTVTTDISDGILYLNDSYSDVVVYEISRILNINIADSHILPFNTKKTLLSSDEDNIIKSETDSLEKIKYFDIISHINNTYTIQVMPKIDYTGAEITFNIQFKPNLYYNLSDENDLSKVVPYSSNEIITAIIDYVVSEMYLKEEKEKLYDAYKQKFALLLDTIKRKYNNQYPYNYANSVMVDFNKEKLENYRRLY